ncbi:hypothetical protein KGM_208901 [Danaus plexippus plexippus]|uniref:Uncharacterized protein n=1 Tax=Danaus plexippus plexippus TaxID=278856 RepID=A0A212EW28_DANPL|nr:hypothetical protein KGM_208901 [Danaus plexippus plexippus]
MHSLRTYSLRRCSVNNRSAAESLQPGIVGRDIWHLPGKGEHWYPNIAIDKVLITFLECSYASGVTCDFNNTILPLLSIIIQP